MNKDINLKAVALGGLMIAGFVFLWFQTGLLPINNNSQLGAVSSSKDTGIGLVTEVKAGEQINTSVTSGLVADYNFNIDLNDSTSNHNNGAWVGTPAYDTGRLGTRAISLTGTNYISVPDSNTLDLADKFSISLWFKKTNASTGSDCEILMSKGAGAYVPAINGSSCIAGAGQNTLNLCISGFGCVTTSSNTITDTNWNHLVMIKDGPTRTIYINNTNVSSWRPSNSPAGDNTHKLFIGADNNGVGTGDLAGFFFKGLIDELHIYSKALSQDEVFSLFTSEGGSPQPQVRLTVNKQGTGASAGTVISSVPSGAIDCGSTCNINFNQNASVTLTASVGSGATFSSWSGCTSTNGTSCTVSMNVAKTVTANFNAVATECSNLPGTSLPKLTISSNGRFLTKGNDSAPFFWLGDTAWWIDNLSDEDVCHYLQTRHDQGFTGIQMMGVMPSYPYPQTNIQNPDDFNARLPFINNDSNNRDYDPGLSYPFNANDPTHTTNAYWNRQQWIVKQAEAKGLYVMLFPVWGDVIPIYMKTSGQLDPTKAYSFGDFLAGTVFSNNNSILWSVSGEYDSINSYRPENLQSTEFAMFNQLGLGLNHGDGSNKKIKTIHPGAYRTSVTQHDQLGGASWLDFNMNQSAHQFFSNGNDPTGRNQESYSLIENGYNRIYSTPSTHKPIYDGEPFYENLVHGYYFLNNPNEPRANAAIVRAKAYWDVFSGAFGHTYGADNVFLFWTIGANPNNPWEQGINWRQAVNFPGATTMVYLKNLINSKPFLTRVPDQGLIASTQPACTDIASLIGVNPMNSSCAAHMQATRASDGPNNTGSYALIYVPRTTTTSGTTQVRINMTKLSGTSVTARWYDPTNGNYTNIPGTFSNTNVNQQFDTNTHPLTNSGGDQDWVLVLESTGTQTQLPAPVITSPIQGSSVGTTATFSWNAVSGAASYLVRLRDDSGSNTGPCNLVVCVDNYANTSYQFTNLIPGHSYSAWVHAASPGWSYGDPLSYSPASTVTFTVSSGGTLIQPVSAYSRKVQGSLPFDLELNLSGTPTVEPRMFPLTASSTHQMIIKFDPTLAPVSLSGATVTLGTVTNFAVSGTDVIVNLRDIPNTQTITVILQNVTRGQASNNVSVSMSALVGDTNGDGLVNSADKIIVRSNSGSIVSQSNFLSDVAVNGSINSGDVSLITKRLGDQLTPITPPTIFDLDVTFTPSNNLSTQASDCLLGDTFSAKTGERCSTTQSSSPSSTSFTRNLGGGSQGTDVLVLQRYLITKGYLGAGYDNSYYGYQTIYAVQRLQTSAGIPSTGYFGELTRAYVVSH